MTDERTADRDNAYKKLINENRELREENKRLADILRDVIEDAAVDDIDPRLNYVVVQMSRETLPAARAALDRHTKDTL